MCGLMSDLVICKFEKAWSYMTPNVLTETWCLNNTNQTQPLCRCSAYTVLVMTVDTQNITPANVPWCLVLYPIDSLIFASFGSVLQFAKTKVVKCNARIYENRMPDVTLVKLHDQKPQMYRTCDHNGSRKLKHLQYFSRNKC